MILSAGLPGISRGRKKFSDRAAHRVTRKNPARRMMSLMAVLGLSSGAAMTAAHAEQRGCHRGFGCAAYDLTGWMWSRSQPQSGKATWPWAYGSCGVGQPVNCVVLYWSHETAPRTGM